MKTPGSDEPGEEKGEEEDRALAHLGSEREGYSGLEAPNTAEGEEEAAAEDRPLARLGSSMQEGGEEIGAGDVLAGCGFVLRERETRMMPMAARRATSWDCGDERSASRTRCVRTLTAAGRASAAMRRARAW